jgi:hypothetical protein
MFKLQNATNEEIRNIFHAAARSILEFGRYEDFCLSLGDGHCSHGLGEASLYYLIDQFLIIVVSQV